MTLRLAVYGTLRRGEVRARFLEGARFLGNTRVAGFSLLDLGAYPGAVEGGDGVLCEVYELPESRVLQTIDREEGVAFRRVLVDALGAPAWLYAYRGSAPGTPIAGGDWAAYVRGRRK